MVKEVTQLTKGLPLSKVMPGVEYFLEGVYTGSLSRFPQERFGGLPKTFPYIDPSVTENFTEVH